MTKIPPWQILALQGDGWSDSYCSTRNKEASGVYSVWWGEFTDGLNLLPSITEKGGDELLSGIQHPGVMFWRSHLLSLGKVIPDFDLITCLDVFIFLCCKTAKEPWEIAEHR